MFTGNGDLKKKERILQASKYIQNIELSRLRLIINIL